MNDKQAPPKSVPSQPIDFARRVRVEQRLLDAASGKQPLPDRDECRALAHILGIPDEYREPSPKSDSDEYTEELRAAALEVLDSASMTLESDVRMVPASVLERLRAKVKVWRADAHKSCTPERAPSTAEALREHLISEVGAMQANAEAAEEPDEAIGIGRVLAYLHELEIDGGKPLHKPDSPVVDPSDIVSAATIRLCSRHAFPEPGCPACCAELPPSAGSES